MNNIEKWFPTRYVFKNGKLRASSNKTYVNPSSRIILDLIAGCYSRHIQNNVKGKLLDLGCGNVPLYQAYKPYITDNICVDWGSSYTKNIFIDFELDLNEPLPFSENEFDTIILSDVLEHIKKPNLLLKEMHRVLNSGGKALINVPFFYGLHEQPYDYFRYTKHGLTFLSEDTGFKIELIEAIGGSPEIFGDLVSKHISVLPLIGNNLSVMVYHFVKFFLFFRLGKKVSTKTAEFFPLGYMLILSKK